MIEKPMCEDSCGSLMSDSPAADFQKDEFKEITSGLEFKVGVDEAKMSKAWSVENNWHPERAVVKVGFLTINLLEQLRESHDGTAPAVTMGDEWNLPLEHFRLAGSADGDASASAARMGAGSGASGSKGPPLGRGKGSVGPAERPVAKGR